MTDICVTLTTAMQAELYAVAESWQRDKDLNRTRRKATIFNDTQLAYMGVKGEYVVSQVYGVPFNSVSYGASGDSGIDVCTPTPGAVKTTHRKTGYLILERWGDISKVKVMHLVAGTCQDSEPCRCVTFPPVEDQTWRYVGWVTVEEFKEHSTYANWGLGPRRFMRQSQLHHGLI